MKPLLILAIFLLTCSAMPTDSWRKRIVCAAFATGYLRGAQRVIDLENYKCADSLLAPAILHFASIDSLYYANQLGDF